MGAVVGMVYHLSRVMVSVGAVVRAVANRTASVKMRNFL